MTLAPRTARTALTTVLAVIALTALTGPAYADTGAARPRSGGMEKAPGMERMMDVPAMQRMMERSPAMQRMHASMMSGERS